MRWHSIAIMALAVSLAACDDGADADADADVDTVGDADEASPCDCGSGEFCCIDHCQPLGSVCGAADGDADLDGDADADADADEEIDGDADADAGPPPCDDRPGPDGGMVPTTSRCFDAVTLWDCAGHTTSCNESFPDCFEWYDPATSAWVAGCLESWYYPCDPAVDVNHCEDAFEVFCNQNINYPTYGPPGFGMRVDCRERWGADGVCVESPDGLGCDSPTAEHCDPETYVRECTEDLSGRIECAYDIGIVEVQPCEVDHYCLDNEYTRASPVQVDCIFAGAVSSDSPPTTDEVILACAGEDTVLVEQYGMEWVAYCEPALVILPDGSSEWRDTVCYDETLAPRCELPDTEHCDPATFVARCSDDGIGALSCVGDVVQYASCGTFGIDGVCDPATSACVPFEPCHEGWPYEERCVVDDTYRMVCHGDIGMAVPEPCPDCHVDTPGGPALCG
jgi:hypothetical protein